MIKKSDQCGVLYVAEPLDACSDLANTVIVEEGSTVSPPYVLIIRGGCSFEIKIRNAQKAGYKAAIVYDNEDYGFLVSSENHLPPLFRHNLLSFFFLLVLIGRMGSAGYIDVL